VTARAEQFELVEFGWVAPASGPPRLRLSAQLPEPTENGRVTLVVGAGPTAQRELPLPSLPGPPGVLRAAFPAPPEAAETFALEFADGTSVTLPKPSRPVAPPPPPPAPARPEARSDEARTLAARLSSTERRAEQRRITIAELEHRLQRQRERHSAAEAELERTRAELAQTRGELQRLHAELQASAAELQVLRVELEQRAARAAAMVREQASAAEALTGAQAEIERLRDELVDYDRRLEELFDRTTAERARAEAALTIARARR
jgi:hypothetical protein